MNKSMISLFFSLLICLFLCACGDSTPEETTLPTEAQDLTATEETPTEPPTEPPTEAPTEPVDDTVYLVDRRTYYDEDGNITEYYQNYYDEQGRITHTELVLPDGTIDVCESYTYFEDRVEIIAANSFGVTLTVEYWNEQGIVTRSEETTKGLLPSATEVMYNEQGNKTYMKIERVILSFTEEPKTTVLESWYVYADDGVTLLQLSSSRDGASKSVIDYSYEYYKDGSIQKKEGYQGDALVSVSCYDKNGIEVLYQDFSDGKLVSETVREGNLSTWISYEDGPDGTVAVVESELEYDEHNNIIRSTYYWESGTTIVEETYIELKKP